MYFLVLHLQINITGTVDGKNKEFTVFSKDNLSVIYQN